MKEVSESGICKKNDLLFVLVQWYQFLSMNFILCHFRMYSVDSQWQNRYDRHLKVQCKNQEGMNKVKSKSSSLSQRSLLGMEMLSSSYMYQEILQN